MEQLSNLSKRCSYQEPYPSHQLFTDASQTGWGANLELEGLLFHRAWIQDQSQLHICLLEMMTVTLALKQTHHHVINSTVLVFTDNTTVVAYLQRQGGTHSPDFCLEVWNTLIWYHQIKIYLAIRQIPEKLNILTDCLSSRNKLILTDGHSIDCKCNFSHDQISQHISVTDCQYMCQQP